MARIESTWDHQVGLPTTVRHTKITNIPRSTAMRHWCNVVFWVRTIFWWFRNWFFDHIYFTDDTSMTATTSLHKNQRIVETLGTFWFSGDDPDTQRKHCGKHVYCCGYNRIDMGPGHSQVTINSSNGFAIALVMWFLLMHTWNRSFAVLALQSNMTPDFSSVPSCDLNLLLRMLQMSKLILVIY